MGGEKENAPSLTCCTSGSSSQNSIPQLPHSHLAVCSMLGSNPYFSARVRGRPRPVADAGASSSSSEAGSASDEDEDDDDETEGERRLRRRRFWEEDGEAERDERDEERERVVMPGAAAGAVEVEAMGWSDDADLRLQGRVVRRLTRRCPPEKRRLGGLEQVADQVTETQSLTIPSEACVEPLRPHTQPTAAPRRPRRPHQPDPSATQFAAAPRHGDEFDGRKTHL